VKRTQKGSLKAVWLCFWLCLWLICGSGFCRVAFGDGTVVRIQDYLLNDPGVAAGMDHMVKDFESKFPSVKVVLEKVSSQEEAIENVKSGQGGDVLRVDSYYVSNLADRKLVANLNPYIEKTGAVDYYWRPQFAEHAVIPCIYDKKMYAVPQEGSPTLIYVNKELCSKAGLNVENAAPRSWEEFLAYARKLSDAGED
jgi:ABC-type glycerol-3-phosphate transport system substrate-binding protein